MTKVTVTHDSKFTLVGSEDDMILNLVADVARSRNVSFGRQTMLDYAGNITIEHDAGNVRVYPELPLLMRPEYASPDISESVLYQRREAYAHVWAACALNCRCVINRPMARPTPTYLPADTLTALHRLAVGSGEGLPKPWVEIFTKAIPAGEIRIPFPPPGTALTWQDLVTGDTSYAPMVPTGSGPYRMRVSPRTAGFVWVIVVGSQAWVRGRVSGLQPAAVSQTIRLVRLLGLAFACATWALPVATSVSPFLVRVDPNPSLWQLGEHAESVALALFSTLTDSFQSQEVIGHPDAPWMRN